MTTSQFMFSWMNGTHTLTKLNGVIKCISKYETRTSIINAHKAHPLVFLHLPAYVFQNLHPFKVLLICSSRTPDDTLDAPELLLRLLFDFLGDFAKSSLSKSSRKYRAAFDCLLPRIHLMFAAVAALIALVEEFRRNNPQIDDASRK